jgi:hypothetical protein
LTHISIAARAFSNQ